jgi:hypothetical protein
VGFWSLPDFLFFWFFGVSLLSPLQVFFALRRFSSVRPPQREQTDVNSRRGQELNSTAAARTDRLEINKGQDPKRTARSANQPMAKTEETKKPDKREEPKPAEGNNPPQHRVLPHLPQQQ